MNPVDDPNVAPDIDVPVVVPSIVVSDDDECDPADRTDLYDDDGSVHP